MKTCAFITLGCKVNQYETQAIRESLTAKGFVETVPEQAADLYVINTCTVTSASDDKSRQHIKRVKRKNPNATVVVTGCYAEADAEAVKKLEGVDFVITKAEEAQIAEIVCRDTVPRIPLSKRREWGGDASIPGLEKEAIYHLKISQFAGHTRAFLKIEDGCDQYCSYCIIPYVRGSIKSRRPQDILEEARRLIDNGFKEIILTGIHLGAYGKDTRGSYRLLDIIQTLSNLSGLKRLRLSSIEANEITHDLIDLMLHSKKICPHFHIPLQSGDDSILKRMNRRYTSSQYLEILDDIRSKINIPSFTTDIIVGFPGEQDEHFENTVNLCKRAGFSRMHIFPFSVRESTPAAKMNNHCSPQTINRRKTLLDVTAKTLAFSYKKQFLGAYAEVLVEKERDSKTNKLCGYSERYIKVLFEGPDTIKNSMVSVRIEDVAPSFAMGILQ
ncbi:tRNA (N(6)-L-threonylcarbamoyladenosine(37)-C(2))-methylthiotransferase MtaB [Candidatus Brocadia sapporoensis]|uniref:Threonylcarbamoyladenosine tRNA methylthiotransferase MtaB n=1 Tax=Candidatus Brocadia sapporoensis TaxID=392547 RepID=A0A1V6LWU5_9BACT|nr:tRNA (N(6)-L-threonylcarbamoyladenosine(37)-C(2))-methylthiotransferase MtaB [Candidatus Brocadia sapporoensis]MDG6004276.1 tRNA (N(6)-L-threonylcarbamoyladenosine(37)-C(2))-methylthiotransferase MtaB [Candidatus Brocadia sp.]OQD44609.1 tRNA (N(6)-L-threonylcarbamoyladenosine(37)-C(2))-methylthiotransferase MtaB [Candidatus Brocadia sapporoensis]GJQ23333.1 MAG: tRNA (N(6)-L-threonylcarbamoyladenosine(37)-C(2))-methylthiotransferase MtaB [Candidatus Brocadia sapporoensis]